MRRKAVRPHTGDLPTEIRGPDAEQLLDKVCTRDLIVPSLAMTLGSRAVLPGCPIAQARNGWKAPVAQARLSK